MTIRTVFSTATATGAALSLLLATPASAADLAVSTVRSDIAPVAAWDTDAQNAKQYRGYRYRGHRYRGYRHRNRVDAGDVIAGIAILGGIAAIASAASKDRDGYRDRRYRDRRYPAAYPRADRSSGLDRAADMCVREIERDVRVEQIDRVDRNASGWDVTGSLYNGERFTCRIGPDGRIDDIDYGQGAYGTTYAPTSNGGYEPAEDRQWDDTVYVQARAATGYATADMPGEPVPPAATGGQPAYPGGPVDGEPLYPGDEDSADGFGA